MSAYCQCGHLADLHDDEYGYCKCVVNPPEITAGAELAYWPCACRHLVLAERHIADELERE